MKFDYNDSGVRQGRANQANAHEQPNTFGTDSGAPSVKQFSSLDKPKQRMAGEVGQRLKDYMTNPMEMERTDSWMSMFENSNEGKQFNQAKMGGPPAQ